MRKSLFLVATLFLYALLPAVASAVTADGLCYNGADQSNALVATTTDASVAYVQSVKLKPGWNVVSTPRVLVRQEFSAPGAQFQILTLDPSRVSGWATMADLGQQVFQPLQGYFVNNLSGVTQMLTYYYKANTTPAERLFSRVFRTPGWHLFGVADGCHTVPQGAGYTDKNNPSSLLSTLGDTVSRYAAVVDFTRSDFLFGDLDSVRVGSSWQMENKSPSISDTTSINSLPDFR